MKKTFAFALHCSLLVPCAPAAGQAASSFQEWKEKIDGLFEEMRTTVRRRDTKAFEKEAAELIEGGVLPPEMYRQELENLLGFVPSGVLLSAVVRSLVKDGHPDSIETLFEGLSRTDFQDLKGRPLGEGRTEARLQVIEFYVMQLADRAWSVKRESLVLSPEFEARVTRELESEDQRRIRCAAYILGAARCKAAAPAIVGALGRVKDSPETRAMLIEALGRADPGTGAQEFEKAAVDSNPMVRHAALPALGFVRGDAADKLIREAFDQGEWATRRAALDACKNRGDLFAMDLIMERYPKETPRLQHDMLEVLLDLTGGILPPDPKEWKKWWALSRKDFKPRQRGKEKVEGKTKVIIRRPQYFGLELWSNQLAICIDVSGSMASSNISIGSSGVAVEGALKSGSPFEIAKDQTKRLLKSFKGKNSFNIIAFNESVNPFQTGLVAASPKASQGASAFLDKTKPEGGSNMYDALLSAFKIADVDTITLFSDGEPTDGLRTDKDDILASIQILNRFRKTRIHTIQIGEDSELMKELAAANQGKYRVLEVSGEKPAEKKP